MSEPGDSVRDEVADLVAETQRHLLWLRDAGVTTLKRSDAEATPGAARAAPTERFRPSFLAGQTTRPAPASKPPPSPVVTTVSQQPPLPPSPVAAPVVPVPVAALTTSTGTSRLAALQAIRQDLGRCERCQLSKTRNTIVWGQGNPEAELVFVGEAPGEDEDLSGIPFVGKAGQLLTKMIEAMGYTRDDVYICNILKCRPPGNRAPEADEVEQCRPFLERQVEAIQPKVIVVMGNTAAKALLRTTTGITTLRNHWQEWHGIPVMPTFHPSYLLRDPTEKPKAWDDLKLVLAKLGRPTRR